MAIFGSFAALFALSFSQSLTPSIAPIARPVLVALLFAQPHPGLPIAQIRPVASESGGSRCSAPSRPGRRSCCFRPSQTPRRAVAPIRGDLVRRLLLLRGRDRSGGLVRAREPAPVRRRPGPARLCRHRDRSLRRLDPHRRPHGRRAAAGEPAADSTAVTRFLVLIAALGYVAAFVPPGWFRRFINRAASFQLVRKLVAPPTELTPGALWADLARTAREILGAQRVSVLPGIPGAALAIVGEMPEREWAPGTRQPVISTVELSVGRARTSRSTWSPISKAGRCSSATTLHSSPTSPRLPPTRSIARRCSSARRGPSRGRGVPRRTRQRGPLPGPPRGRSEPDPGPRRGEPRDLGDAPGRRAVRLPGRAAHRDPARRPRGAAQGRDADPAGRPARLSLESTGRRIDGTHFPAEIARSTFELDGRSRWRSSRTSPGATRPTRSATASWASCRTSSGLR